MEEMYSQICSYLQECVNNDIYTEDEAQEIADIAYNRYMVEGNAYNKYANNLRKENDKHNAKDAIYKKVGAYDANPKLYDNMVSKAKAITAKNNQFTADSNGFLDDYEARGNSRIFQAQRRMKRHWMDAKGNKGTRPEDRYKEDRYLKAQKELRDLEKGRKKIDVKSMNDKVKKKVAEAKQNS